MLLAAKRLFVNLIPLLIVLVGNLYVAWVDTTWSKYLTFKYNTDGSFGWSDIFNGTAPYYLGRPFDVSIDGNNNLYVAGWGWCSPNCDLGGTPATFNNAVIRYNASNGTRIGYFLFGDYLNKAGPRIAVDNNNRLFLISPLYEKNYVAKFEINSPPSLSLFNDSPDPIVVGNNIMLSATWTDPDSPEQGKVHFCKTNQITPSSSGGSCIGTTLASSALSAPGAVSLPYTTQSADLGTVTYYVFACDDGGKCTGTTGNSGTFTVTQPDLWISVGPTASPASPTAGSNVTFSATVKNIGTATANQPIASRIEIDTNSSSFATADVTVTVPNITTNIASNGTANVTSVAWTAVQGTHAVRICTDTAGTVSESNESNNCSGATTLVLTVGAALQPDLSISAGPPASPASPTAGSNVTFSATVKNIGTATANQPIASRIEIDTNSSSFATADVTVTVPNITTNIVSNGTANITSAAWTAVQGTHAVRICTDTAGTVSESNESNNCSGATTLVLTVGAAFDYSLSNSGSISVAQSGSGANTITRTLNSGTTQGVTLSASGLPSGASASFTTN